MQSLGEILRHDDPHYLRYLSRKTQYLITRDKNEFVHRFWQHLITEYHPQVVLPQISASGRKTLFTLLKYFAHDNRIKMRKKYQQLEKQIPWVLLHPQGGYFVPFEIIKTLMPQARLIPSGYLFQLLYQMPKGEQHSLRALLARTHRSREAMTDEKHALDRALALYIWTADHSKTQTIKEKFPEGKNIWLFLKTKFPKFTADIDEWQYIMQTSQRGFYRSLSLLNGAELLKRYVAALRVVPLATRSHKVYPATNLRYVIPTEFLPDTILTKR